MRPNQLLLGTFLNFLTLFDKRKTANNKNVEVFIFLHNAMIQGFLVHCFTNLQFFCPSEARINSTWQKDSQILLCGCFDEYEREVTPLKTPILSFCSLLLLHDPLWMVHNPRTYGRRDGWNFSPFYRTLSTIGAAAQRGNGSLKTIKC